MADFNAGSIEGTVDLNLDPFMAGLSKAQAEAEKFESRDITRTVRTVQEGDEEPEHVGDETATLSLDDSEFHAELDADKLELDKFGAEKKTATIDVDTAKARLALDALRAKIDSVAGTYNAHSNPLSGGEGGGHGLMYLVGLAAALAPALGPATAAFGLFSAAGVAGFAAVAVSAAAYGAVASKAFEKIQDAIKAGKQLPGVAGQAETAFKGLNTAWDKFQAAVDPGIFKVMVAAFNQLASLLPEFEPIINTMSKGLVSVVNQIGALFKRDDAQEFLQTINSLADKDIPKLGTIIVHVFGGLMDLFDSLAPVMQLVVKGAVQLSAEFEKWANLKSNGFVESTLSTVQKYAGLTKTLFKDLGGALVNIGKDLAPLTGPALTFLDGLAKALKGLDLAPLAKGIGDVLVAATPFLGVVSDLVNILLPPLKTLLETISDDLIGPLGKSLTSELTPAFDALASMLNTLAPVLGEFVSSIADLVNPTGVGLLASLITGLQKPVNDLVGPVGDLLTALESMVDDGLEAITPAVGPVTDALDGLAKGLTPVIAGLAWFLSHKAVADTILGIAAAVKATTAATAAWAAVTKGIAAITGIIEAISFGWSGLTVAQDANTASVVANRVAMLAWRAAQLVGAAATGALTAATWLFNAALDANPIVLVIAGVVALGVAAYELVEHWNAVSDAFQKVWGVISDGAQAVFGWFKSHWSDLLAILTGPFGLAVTEIIKHWGDISDFFHSLPGKIKGFFSGVADLLVSAGEDILHGLKTGAQNGWQAVHDFVNAIPDKIVSVLGDLGSLLTGAGKAVIQGLYNGMKWVWDHTLKPFIDGISSAISAIVKLKNKISSPSKVFDEIGRFLMLGLHNGIQAVWGSHVQPLLSTLAGKVSDAFSGTEIAVAGGGSLRLSGTSTLQQGVSSLADAIRALADQQNETIEAVKTIAPAVGDALARANEGHAQAVTDAFKTATQDQTSALIRASRT
jgi:hypothetical protein